jgi:hypothetical protein
VIQYYTNLYLRYADRCRGKIARQLLKAAAAADTAASTSDMPQSGTEATAVPSKGFLQKLNIHKT